MNYITNHFNTPAYKVSCVMGVLIPTAAGAVMGPLSTTTVLVTYLGTQIITYLGWQGASRCLAERARCKLGPGLQGWCDDAPPTEHASRLEAKQHIINCLATKNARLDLSNLALSSLPAELGNLKHLTDLRLNGNQLVSLPRLGNCRSLEWIRLEGNPLHSLPPEIFFLSNKDGLIWMDSRDNLSPTLLRQITERTQVSNYKGPQFVFNWNREDRMDSMTQAARAPLTQYFGTDRWSS